MAYKNLKKVLKKRRLRREQKNLFQGETLEPRHAFDGSDALDAALVISPNQAPVNNLPAEQTTFVNQPLAFIRDYVTNTPGNRISITDADAGLNPLRVTISVDSGTMSSVFPDPNGGLTYLEGDGTDDAKMVFEGTLQDIDSFFHWFSYQPAEGFVGDATLTIETNDLGSGSLQRQLVDTDSLRISIVPVPEYAPSPDYDTYPGMFDPTFHGNGRHLRSISDGVDYIKDMKILGNGKVLAIGTIDGRAAVMRFNSDMHHLDESFGESNGYTRLNSVNYNTGSEFSAFRIDELGRIIAAGDRYVARFNSEGLRDATFGTDGIVYDSSLASRLHYKGTPYSVGIRSDAQIVVASAKQTVHLNQSGEIVFKSYGGYQSEVAVVHKQDESVIIFSQLKDYKRRSNPLHVEHSNGGYGERIGATYNFGDYQWFITSVVLRDGSVRLLGEIDNDLAVVGFKPDGTPDLSFGNNGVASIAILSATDTGYRAKVAEDGKLVIVGIADNDSNNDFAIVRLNEDGSVDESFGNYGKVIADFNGSDDRAYAVEILPNGKILAAGKAGNSIGFVQLLGDSRVGVPVSTVYLSETSTVENGAPGSVIGSLTTDSATDNSDTTYALVSGAGDIDNDAFMIVGSELQSAVSFDYETKSSYTVRVRATTVDGHSVEQAFSILIENANDLPTGSVEITGVPTAGETLVAENSIFDQDSVGTLEYQWSRDGVAIEGATAEAYTLSAADVGAVIAVRVNYTDAQGTAETVASEGTSPVAAANQAPFGLNLSAAVIAENKIAGSIVGELSASDPDADDVLTYSLVNGEGDTENDSFEIVGSELRAAESFDFEIQNQYSIRVRATDSAGLLTEKTFSIGISNVNEAPFDLAVSAETINENEVAGSVVGKLTAADPDAEDGLTYSLMDGEEETDNDLFEIVGDELRTKVQFDFESKSSCTVRVRATDSEGSLTEQTFVIAINDINEVPFDLRLSSQAVLENAAVGTVVGELNATDPDADDVLAYSLVAGDGDANNNSFEIIGTGLRATETFDYETKSSYSVRIRVTDSGGMYSEKAFGFEVTDVDETVATGTTFDYLILEAQQAGSTVDIDDIRVTDLRSNTEFYSYDFEADDLTGVELLHSQDSGDEYSENLEMTRIQDGRLRLETTGFLQNGAGGYNSRSRMVIPNQLPDEFEITFTARKLQWAGHFKVILGNSESDYADISTQNGNEFGVHDGDYGFYVLQAGGAVPTHAGVLINLDGEAVEVPTQNSLSNLHNTDARYRIVRQSNELSLYVNDVLIATRNDLVDPAPPINTPETIVVRDQIADQAVEDGSTDVINIDLDNRFDLTDVTGTVVKFDTNAPLTNNDFYVELTSNTPLTNEKFLSYVNDGSYDQSIIHRSVDDFVMQGGGFKAPTVPADQPGSDPVSIPKKGTVQNEPGNLNKRGTLAMAKLAGQPNSATSQWFFNLSDNSFLDSDNGGYTVFGEVLGSGMTVVDTMAGALTYDATTYYSNTALSDLPLWNVNSDNVVQPDDFVKIESVDAVSETELMTFTVSSSNPSVFTAAIVDGDVSLTPVEGASGTTEITVTATSTLDNSLVSDTFTVTLGDATENMVDVPLVIAAEEGVISLDTEITYDPNVVQLHDIAADANLPEGTIAMLTEIAPGRSYLGIMTTPALGDASYVLGSLSATITGSSETLASLVTFENVQLNEGAVSAYDADGNLVIRLGNTAPTGISLSATEVSENSPLYTAVGSFETTDIDTTDQFTYQLVAGDGATDNSDFVIDGNVLRTLSPLDYETQSSYSVRVRSTDTIGQSVEQVFTITVGDIIESLMVTGLTSNQSGFTVSFNEAVSEDELNLYDGFETYGAADVTVIGTVSGAVTGSAVLSDDGMSLVFVSSTPLVNDSYTVVLNSGEKAFVGVDGRLLDGNSDGTAGDNYTQSFVVDDAVSTVVSTPSFARAPGESVDLGTDTQRGLPVQLDSDGSVQTVAFTVEYDPAVIRVESLEKSVSLPAGATMTHSIVTPGNIAVTITSSQAISAGSATLAVVNASINDDADYASSSVVTIKDVVVNGGQAIGTGSSAVHVASKLGDTSGDGTYSAFDAVLAARVAAFKDTGLAAYPMVDPVVVADVSGNGDIKMYDSGLVASVPSDGSSVGPSNSASGNTTNVIFRENGQFGSATVAPTVAGTNERARAFLEYAKANKDQNFANAAAAVASGAGGSSNSGAGESITKKSKLLFAPLPVGK